MGQVSRLCKIERGRSVLLLGDLFIFTTRHNSVFIQDTSGKEASIERSILDKNTEVFAQEAHTQLLNISRVRIRVMLII